MRDKERPFEAVKEFYPTSGGGGGERRSDPDRCQFALEDILHLAVSQKEGKEPCASFFLSLF
jgi:hypothetical protein